MKTNLPTCPQCGQPISQGIKGLCPNCLALIAFGSDAPEAPPAAPTAEASDTLHPSAPAGRLLSSTARYFGDYQLLEEIARGGMGVVFKARQISLNRIVAVKMILSGQLATDVDVKRFRTEAESAANLQHKNIVAIHEVGEHEGRHYFSMDYVAGKNLGELVREQGSIQPIQAAQWVKALAGAVQYANQRGILHRDLKPQNVLIDEAGDPRITDFGLAKKLEVDSSVTNTGAVLGSPAYMPPEQAAGRHDEVGPHSEVYGLGGILYYCLTGRPPFSAESAVATVALVLDQQPESPQNENPAVPTDLATICLKCLEKKPEARYPNARALADELERFLRHEPILAKPPGNLRRAWNWTQRHPWALAGISSIVILVLACIAFGFFENHRRFVWLLAHGSLKSRGAYYSPILEFWIFIVPVLSLACYFGGAYFRRAYSRHDKRRGTIYHLVWAAYLALGLITLGAGLWGLFNTVKLAVWLQDRPSAFTSLMTAPWALCLTWVGACTLWEAAGSHESSLFGDLLDERIKWYLQYHPNRWTLWEIVTCTLTVLLSYGLTFVWFDRLTYEIAGPGSAFALPHVLNFALAATLYPPALWAFVKSRNVRCAALSVALSVALPALFLSGSTARGATFWSRHLFAYTAEKGALIILLPMGFYLAVMLFERMQERLKLLRGTVVLVALILAGVIASFVAFDLSGDPALYWSNPALYFLAWPEALILAYPAIILRTRVGTHRLQRTQLEQPLIPLRPLWQYKVPILGSVLALVAAVQLENWRGEKAWQQAQARWTAQHRPARYADLIPPAVPDAENFWKAPIVQSWIPSRGRISRVSAPTLPRGYESLGAVPYDTSALKTLPKLPPPSQPDSPSLAGLRDWFAQWDGQFDALRQAGELASTQFARPAFSAAGGYYLPEVAPMPDFVRIRDLARIMATRARVHLLNGESDRALADLKTLKGLMRGLESKPELMISAMIRVAIGGLYLDTVRQGLLEGLWPASHLPRLQVELEQIDLLTDVYTALITERNAHCEFLERFARAPLTARLASYYAGGGEVHTTILLSGWTRQNQALFSNLTDPFLRSFELLPGQIASNEVEQGYRTSRQALRHGTPYNVLVRISFPDWSRAITTVAKSQARRNLALTAVALERFRHKHGVYPKNVNDLVPEFAATLPRTSVNWPENTPLAPSTVLTRAWPP